jgi:hypothetical protein
MKTETFLTWQTDETIPERVEITSIRDDNDGLCVVVASEVSRRPVAMLVFEDFVGYRNVNESFRSRTWQSQNNRAPSSLLIVEGSQWLEWLRAESGGVLDEFLLTHYAIYTNDDCIDIAARAAPLVVRIACDG